jgi:hypothetical protein
LPIGGVGGCIVKDAIFDGLQDHVVCTFDLTVPARVCHRGVVDVNEVVLE